jgi:hypothetical protein
MREWMEYVYMQQNKPTNVTGVPVTISVVDANGNYRTVGTATSDASGDYALQWTPDVTGMYHVIATFAGSKAYYGSSAETAFAVDTPAATQTPQATPAPSAADLYFIPAIAGIFVAIIVVIAMIALVLRKHP